MKLIESSSSGLMRSARRFPLRLLHLMRSLEHLKRFHFL